MDTTEIDSSENIHSAVDSDLAGGHTNCRTSVTGIIIQLTGGIILHNKTKYQDTITLSMTEAEFTATCDAGKTILYVNSILDGIKLPSGRCNNIVH